VIVYEKLFEVKIYHGYYSAYSVGDIEFVLPASTQRFLSMYALLYKPTAEGFVVLYKVEKASLIQDIKNLISFTFFVKIKNRHFGNFTLLDYALGGEKYYFNNSERIESVASNPEGKPVLLHPSETVGSGDVVTNIQPNSTLSKVLGGSAIVFEKSGQELFNGAISESITSAELLGTDFGLYDYATEEKTALTKLYYSPPAAPEVFGVIDLYVGDQENVHFDDVRSRVYEVRFSNRPVHWTYYFISNGGHTIEKIEIASGKIPLAFTEPRQVTLINGKKATCVTSEVPLPLMSSYNDDKLLATISNFSSEFSEKRIRLPYPNVTRVKGSVTDGTQNYFSEMYVYV
jgi:hypothetical protein